MMMVPVIFWLQGVVKVAAVNADEHQSLGGQYQIQGFPTIKVFGANKNSPSDYQGTCTSILKSIGNFILDLHIVIKKILWLWSLFFSSFLESNITGEKKFLTKLHV